MELLGDDKLMNCPNCKDEADVLGICDSGECYTDDDSLFCDECYEEHIINSHDYFHKISVKKLKEKYHIDEDED